MRITAVETIMLETPCMPISDALSTSSKRKALLVRIHTDEGLIGMGEAFLYGASPAGAGQILSEQLVPLVLGEDATNTDFLYHKMLWNTMACGRRGIMLGLISGIDIALWDIKAQAQGMSIAKALSTGTVHCCVPSYASGGFYAKGKDLDGLREETRRYLGKGYKAMKMKVGRNPERIDSPLRYMANQENGVTVEDDLCRVEAVRAILGDKKELMIDANASFSAQGLIPLLEKWEALHVSYIEEPLRFENISGLDAIHAKLHTMQVAGFETEQGTENFRTLLDHGCVDIVQADIGWAGGFTGTLELAKMAASYGKKFSLHSFGSAVHFAASLQLAAALDNTAAIESEENENPLRSAISNPFVTDGDMNFLIPEATGLGMSWDLKGIEALRLR